MEAVIRALLLLESGNSDRSENQTWDGLLSAELFWDLSEAGMTRVQGENVDAEVQHLSLSMEATPFEQKISVLYEFLTHTSSKLSYCVVASVTLAALLLLIS